jgi:CHC2 zinc finger/Toprim domain
MSETQEKPRITAVHIARARAVDPIVLAEKYLKLEKRGRAHFALCPFHKETRPSFKIEPGRRYKCFPCGASLDTIEFLQRMTNLSFVDAVLELCNDPKPQPALRIVSRTKNPVDLMTDPKVRKARAIWHSASLAAGSPIETAYFPARALPIPVPPTVRFLREYPWRGDPHLLLPAMLVAVQSPAGGIIGIEATALTLRCDRKAFPDSRDKAGIMAAGAARFAAATETLGIAEGAETAIAAMALTGVPCWACLGAGRMHTVAIPDVVRELHIFADDDEPGRQAAEKTSAAHPGLRRIVRLPPDGCKDWNDVLIERRRAA